MRLYKFFTCSGKATKTETKASPHAGLISGTPEEVRKKLGEPSEVSRTPENRILWVYRPSWQIMPGNSDTFVVQFDNGRVARVFKLN